MASYRLLKTAAQDLRGIALYTVKKFGLEQASTYGNGILACFETIVEAPLIGQSYDHIRPGLRRYDHKSHAIYYLIQDEIVLVVRVLHVLHVRQDSLRHF